MIIRNLFFVYLLCVKVIRTPAEKGTARLAQEAKADKLAASKEAATGRSKRRPRDYEAFFKAIVRYIQEDGVVPARQKGTWLDARLSTAAWERLCLASPEGERFVIFLKPLCSACQWQRGHSTTPFSQVALHAISFSTILINDCFYFFCFKVTLHKLHKKML